MRRRTKWIAIGVIVLLVAWAGYVGIRATDSPEFCASCHYMEPYVQNWKTSSHNDVNCIECHAEPGVGGYLERKTRLLGEVIRYAVGAYSTQPHARLSDEQCLGCHEQETLERTQTYSEEIPFSHEHHYEDASRGVQLRCNTCHSELVQGSHMAVDQSTCVDCHFMGRPASEPLSGCEGCHGPPKDKIQVDGVTFNHSDYAQSDVDCLTCHTHVTQGSGDVPPEKCYSCHIERFEDYGDTEKVHDVHVTAEQLTCRDCHTDIQHGEFQLSQAITPDCRTCHASGHSVQEGMYIGTGGEGVESRPDPMFLSNVTCSGCHQRNDQGSPVATVETSSGRELPKATAQSCVECHGEGFDWLLGNWQAEVGEYQRALVSRFDRVEALVGGGIQTPSLELARQAAELPRSADLGSSSSLQTPSAEIAQQAMDRYERARANLALVQRDRSNGAHNVTYLNLLLERIDYDLQAVAELLSLGRVVPPDKPSLHTSEANCTDCHTGIERSTIETERETFNHGRHLEKGELSCEACHATDAPSSDNHGNTFADAANCTSCHPTQSGVRRMSSGECLQCHSASVEVPSDQVEFSHEGHTSYGCAFCHEGVANEDHLSYIQSDPQVPFDHETCASCHRDNMTGAGDCSTCHTNR